MISTIVSVVTTTTSFNVNNNTTPAIDFNVNSSISNYHVYTSTVDATNFSNFTSFNYNDTLNPVFPSYIRTTSMVFCIIIMCLGVIGNIMVPIVIFKTKDMRNSTNIFLVNLSVADLMVLLVCTPTVLVEVNSKPETWVLGEEMCKAVPFVELTVAHASVLTILAISFERYYAICKPLKAGYICTKARASFICLLAWFIAAVFTRAICGDSNPYTNTLSITFHISFITLYYTIFYRPQSNPILAITQYGLETYYDGTVVSVCFSKVETLLPSVFFILSISVFFFLPLAILLILYALIAKTLMHHPNIMAPACKTNALASQSAIKYRKQVVVMLGTVVLAFFICLLPFRALTLWIIIVPAESIMKIGVEGYYNLLYFSRIMFHINSAINPILYNIMSSKFRGGFFRLCGIRNIRKRYINRTDINRKNTFNTTSSTHTSSQHTSESFWSRYSHRNYSRNSSSKDTKDVPVDAECSRNNNRERILKETYVRIPLHAGNSISNRKIANGESYV